MNITFLKTCLLALFCLVFVPGISQNTSPKADIGLEFQVYPTGVIPGLRLDYALNQKSSLDLRLGYQLIDHQDFGVHENEVGSGFGFTLGYRRFLSKKVLSGFFLGVRNDVWFNTIDWKDDIGIVTEVSGTSKIVVLQPTLQTGWLFSLAGDKLAMGPTLGFGFEINVVTDGAEVGQGAIVLLGLNAAYRISAREKTSKK